MMWWEVKDHLEVRNGELQFAGTPALDIAKEFGTPLYAYNAKRIAANYRRFYEALRAQTDRKIRPHYAMKANSNIGVLQVLHREGAWIDAVSPEEVERAIDVGFMKNRIIFTGTSVSNDDLKRLVAMGIRINIDSLSELERLRRIAPKGYEVSFRMDPGIAGAGHSWKTMTAGRMSHGVPIKFSIPEHEIVQAAKRATDYGFKVVGLHEHIGSKWNTDEEVDEFLQTVDVVLERAKQISAFSDLEVVNFGGGPGVPYHAEDRAFPLERYARETCKKVEQSGLDLEAIAFEPGRFIVADAGLLLMDVVEVKHRYGDIIVGVNSGFNHLIRPVLYESYHEIINCTKAGAAADALVTIAGNMCETGDVFTPEPRKMPMPAEGDVLAVHNAGAYGFVMASRYNLRPLAQEVLLR